MLYVDNFLAKMLWSIRSNALRKSNNITLMVEPLPSVFLNLGPVVSKAFSLNGG